MRKITYIVLTCVLLNSCSSANKTRSVSGEKTEQTRIRDGSSFANAIVVNSINAEYDWVKEHYPGSKINKQSLQFSGKKPYDVLGFTLPDGQEKEFYFDISKFYGKF